LGGISHFIEHLFFKGTSRRPSAQLIAEAIEGVGGVINASTDKEVTTYWTKVPDTHLGLAADVLFVIVSDSRLTPEDIERETAAIRRRYADPEPRLFPAAVTFLVPDGLAT